MPNYENNHVKGDLYITFDVEFPRGGMSDSEKDGRFLLFLVKLFKTFNPLTPRSDQYINSSNNIILIRLGELAFQSWESKG